MKKIVSIMLFTVMAFMGASPACADVGIPGEMLYTVCIDVEGADYYEDYGRDDAPAGRLSGGQKFYVWADHVDGYYMGTTDVSAGSDQYDEFVSIRASDTCPSDETVSPEIGQSTGKTIYAITTDKVNMRCGPGVGFKEIEILEKGTKVDYNYTFDTDSTWVYAGSKGKRGWVNSEYLTRDEEPTTKKHTSGTTVHEDNEESGADRGMVIGIVLVCIGVAIGIAVLTALLLSRKRSGRSQKKQGMIYCRNCGAQIPEGNSFCEECGAPVPATKKENR